MEDWKLALARIDAAARPLAPLLTQFLQSGDSAALQPAVERLLREIPPEVMTQLTHPLTSTAKALAGSLRQAIDGRALFGAGEPPQWWVLLEEGLTEALDDFERELAILMRAGTPGH